MPDPISLIALGAAVGGAAGKFAEKSWEIAEGWLRERFGSHSATARQQAEHNAAQFVRELAISLEKSGVASRTIEKASTHPQFSVVLQSAVIGAAQTSEASKHLLMAKLVANRLSSEAESTYSLASQLAIQAICQTTHRQLTLLAVACFLHEIRPKHVTSTKAYLDWLDIWISKFSGFAFHDIDARHLVAVACVTYDPTSERSLEWLLRLKGGEKCMKARVLGLASIQALEIDWSEGLNGVMLTSVGSIVGGLALDHTVGSDSGLPGWSRKK